MHDYDLFISEWDQDGNGLATYTRPDGRIIWVAVPLSIPGETIKVSSIFKKGKGSVRHRADITSIVKPSLCRVTPLCPHVGACGGCIWQHVSYDLQVETKQRYIESLFTPLIDEGATIYPLIPSESVFEYRNKMEFSFSQDKAGKQFLGLFGQRGRVIHLNECHLVKPWVGELLQAVRSWWVESSLQAYNWRNNSGSLQNLTVRESMTTGDRMVILTVSGNSEYALSRPQLDAFCEKIKMEATPTNADISIVLSIRQIAPKRPTQFFDMILFGKDHIRETLTVQLSKQQNLDFHIGPRSFFQPNTLQAEKIYSKALSLASLNENDTVLDLYCGIGVFGMFAALEVKKAVGIELSRDSAYDATINSQRFGLGNFSVYAGDVVAMLPSISEACPDVVIVDPPRAGLQRAVEQISLLKPKKLVYVSCNPRTQADDVIKLKQAGWQISAIQPVDQFPHTPHVENIVVLRNGN